MYFIPSRVSLNRLLAFIHTALTLFTKETSQAFRFISDKETHIQTTSQDFVRDKFYWFIERSLVLDIVGSCLAYGRGVILLVSYLLNLMHSWCVASALKHSRILMHKDNIWGHFRAIKTKLNKTTTKHFFSVQDSLIKMLLEEGESSISIKIPYLKMCI